MRSLAMGFAFLLACAGALAQAGTDGTDLMNRGVAAYRSGRYADAAEVFRKALATFPTPLAHQFLGATYAAQVVPGVDSPHNRELGEFAIKEFEAVLRQQPGSKGAVEGEADVYRNLGRLEEARAAEKRALLLDPENPGVPYNIGVIDWQQAHKNATDALGREKLTDDGVGNSQKSAAVCAQLRTQNSALVEEAIVNLTHALELKPNYQEAMIYLALVYRRRADLHCDDPVSVKADLDMAEDWQRQAKDIRDQMGTAPRPSR